MNVKPRLDDFTRIIVFLGIVNTTFPALAADENEQQMLNSMLGSGYASIVSGYDQQLSDAPGIVDVITAEEIVTMGATTLEQVLATVPGFHISTARGVRSLFTVRGIFSESNNDLLIKIDDVAIRDPITASRPLVFSMPVRNISRVEVVRGPGSVMHGSDAVSGVVNIITKTGKELITDPARGQGGHITAYGGSFDTYGGALSGGGKNNDLEYALSIQVEDTNGSDRKINSDAATFFDNLFMTSTSNAPGTINQEKTQVHAHLDLGYQEKLRFRLGVRVFEDVGTGTGLSFALAPDDAITDRWINADIEYDGNIGSSINTKSTISYQAKTHDSDFHHLPPGSPLIPNGLNETFNYFMHQLKAQFMATSNHFPDHRIQFGAGTHMDFITDIKHKRNFMIVNGLPVPVSALVETQTLGRDRTLDRRQRIQLFAMIQDEWSFMPDWKLNTGLRIDSFSDESTVLSPRLALVYHFSPIWTGKLLYNRSFHMPSFYEQALGNNIEPEIINMLEMAIEAKDFQANTFRFSWYAYKLNNLATPLNASNGVLSFESIDLLGTGGELSLKKRFTDTLSTKLSYSVNWTVEDGNKSIYGLAPNHMIYAEINWEFLPTWNISNQIKWISERKRTDIDSRKPLNGYTLGAVNLSKEFHYANFRQLRLNLKIDNLFNVDVREPSVDGQLLPGDIPLPGRSFMGIVEMSF